MRPPRQPNAYTGSPLDRVSHRRDDDAFVAGRLADPTTVFVPVWRSKSLFRGGADGAPEPALLSLEAAAALGLERRPRALLGLWGERAVFAIDLSADEDPMSALGGTGELRFADLREVAGLLPAAEASVLAHARGLMHWRGRHGFCGVCGAACRPASGGHVMVCTGCGASHFPRTDPAVIMLVTCRSGGEERCLLAHSRRFPIARMYSTLAGFVEPGESLEEAVAREVREEAGLRVRDVRYHSSQPWPFPSSIMLGFTAETDDAALTLDDEEIADARWFTRGELRDPEGCGIRLPRVDSIARRLILDWLEDGG
ncbi:MAG: NAD(+) diphosphatase [Acetobacteraceae bacterium]